jgi:hypothetical protein
VNAYRFHIHNPGKSFGSNPNFVDSSELDRLRGFSSLYAITEDAASAIVQEGTTRKFAGVVWSERLWIDVDSYELAERTEGFLRESGYDYIAYDSGGRGAHFGVRRDHIPSHLLPQRDKAWVRENIPGADLSIYTHLHLFRLPGTVHERTGRQKEVVSRSSGRSIVLPPFQEQTVALSKASASAESKSVFGCFRVLRETVPVEVGERHAALVRLAYALCQEANTDPDFAYAYMLEVNKMYSEPKDEAEIEKIVRDVYGDVA